MLTCQQLTERVTDYLDGRLSVMEGLSFRLHLGMCRRCRAFVQQMKATIQTLGLLPSQRVPAAVRAEILGRYRKAFPRGGARSTRAPWPLRLLASLETFAGRRRGWPVAGVILFSAFACVFALGVHDGGPGSGIDCLLAESAGGAVLVGLLVLLASASRTRPSAPLFQFIAMVGSLAGFAILQAQCPLAHIASHSLLFHVGGIALAGIMGLGVSRLAIVRTR